MDSPARDPRLNFSSPQFDPLLALLTPDLEAPVPEAPVFDNISKCSSLLPADAATEVKPQRAPASEASKAKAAALKQRVQTAAQRAAASVSISSLAVIMSVAAQGPLAVLAKWHASGQAVQVVTRHAAGVRGRAVGILKGFDRFMNLLLTDVEETYTVIVKVPRVQQRQLVPPESSSQTAQGPAVSAQATAVAQLGIPDVAAASSRQQNAGNMQQLVGKQQEQQQQQSTLHAVWQQLPVQQQQGQQQQPGPQQQLQQLRQQQQAHQSIAQQQQQQHRPQQEGQQSCAGSARPKSRWCRKQEQRFRKMNQIILKGDNIVLISSTVPKTLQ